MHVVVREDPPSFRAAYTIRLCTRRKSASCTAIARADATRRKRRRSQYIYVACTYKSLWGRMDERQCRGIRPISPAAVAVVQMAHREGRELHNDWSWARAVGQASLPNQGGPAPSQVGRKPTARMPAVHMHVHRKQLHRRKLWREGRRDAGGSQSIRVPSPNSSYLIVNSNGVVGL